MSDHKSTTENKGSPSSASATSKSLMAKFRAAQKAERFQEKIRPYQDKINKVRIVMYAIAIPWAVYVGNKIAALLCCNRQRRIYITNKVCTTRQKKSFSFAKKNARPKTQKIRDWQEF